METNPHQTAAFAMQHALEARSLHQAAFDVSEAENYGVDAETLRFVAANGPALAFHNKSLRDFLHLHIWDLLPDSDTSKVRRLLAKVRKRAGKAVTFRAMQPDNHGGQRLCRITIRFIDGARPSYFIFLQNMTGYKDAKIAAIQAEDILSTAINALPDGFVLYDRNDQLVLCNDRYREVYHQSSQAMQKGASFKEIIQFGLDNGQYADAIGREDEWLAERLSAHKQSNSTVEQQLSDGTWLHIVERPTRDGGRVGLRMDITELKGQQERLRHAARTDFLTGLLNRRGISEHLEHLASDLGFDERIALLHVDLDKFKAVNDAQGHDAGDHVLRHCADLLKSQVDGCDNVVARAGGDEFIVLLRTEDDDDDIQKFGQLLIKLLSRPVSFRNRVCNIGASIGISMFCCDGPDNLTSALSAADIALNEAKRDGRGLCYTFKEEMRHEALRFIEMAQEIRVGLQQGQFEPFFQPQINARSGAIVGFEALIRWRHPEKGLVPAFLFLTAAERAGLMDEIDALVMDRACFAASQLANWGVPESCVSINMSMPQLRDPKILKRLLDHTQAYGICPSRLRIELLESVLLDDRSATIIENVHRFIEHGFRIELDDFGTGHAAIASLRKFAVSRIKIDRSLIENIDSDSELQVITGAIIELADRLGVKALAEGVETIEEQQQLISLGCECAQGYLHARPMPLVQLRGWVAATMRRLPAAACRPGQVLA